MVEVAGPIHAMSVGSSVNSVFTRVVNHCDTVLATQAGGAPETKFRWRVAGSDQSRLLKRNTTIVWGKNCIQVGPLGRFDKARLENACEAESAFVNHDEIVFPESLCCKAF
jgi:hypothetical protein